MKLIFIMGLVLSLCGSVWAEDKAIQPKDMHELTTNGFELSGGEYWVYVAGKEFNYPDDVLWGLMGEEKNDGTAGQAPEKAQACAVKAYNKLMDFYKNPPVGMKNLIEVGKTTNKFFLWVNDYTVASETEEVRPNSFWHWNRGPKDYSQGYWKWESTLTKDGQCLVPDDLQISEKILEVSKILKL